MKIDSKKRNKKRVQKYRKIKFSFMTILFAVILTISVFTTNAKAEEKHNGNADYKYYTSYLVMPGDSLWSIAEENIDYNHYQSVNDYVDEIMKMNQMHSDQIKIGEYILITYYSNDIK